jgi:hypothetical protein
MATGKHPGHFASGNDCSQCHNTVTWGSAFFDHADVIGNCVSCHNGSTAAGKTPNHPPTSNLCEDCHTTVTWANARFDHNNVTGSCVTCHNGTTATGKHPSHLITAADCGTCHSTVAWSPAGFDHSAITGNCGSCHNGSTATGKPPQHFVTSLDCDTCHLTGRWSPDVFQHTSPLYPGDHAGNPSCQACHMANSQMATWSHPMYQPDCAGCHANDFEQDAHKKVDSPTIFYTVSELRDCAGACHQYTDATLQNVEKMRNGEHRVTQGEF